MGNLKIWRISFKNCCSISTNRRTRRLDSRTLRLPSKFLSRPCLISSLRIPITYLFQCTSLQRNAAIIIKDREDIEDHVWMTLSKANRLNSGGQEESLENLHIQKGQPYLHDRTTYFREIELEPNSEKYSSSSPTQFSSDQKPRSSLKLARVT